MDPKLVFILAKCHHPMPICISSRQFETNPWFHPVCFPWYRPPNQSLHPVIDSRDPNQSKHKRGSPLAACDHLPNWLLCTPKSVHDRQLRSPPVRLATFILAIGETGCYAGKRMVTLDSRCPSQILHLAWDRPKLNKAAVQPRFMAHKLLFCQQSFHDFARDSIAKLDIMVAKASA
jgi:hypothetical protein